MDRTLGLVAFILSVLVWPPIPAFATAPRWALLSIAVPAMISVLSIGMTAAHWVGLAFLGYAAISLLWTPVLIDGIAGLWQMALLAGAFCIGAEARSLDWFYRGLALGVGVSAVIALFQNQGMSPVFETATPGGLFANRNFLAETAAMVFAGTIGTPLLAIGAVIALACTQSLGALGGASLAFVLWLLRRSIVLGLLLGAIGVAGLVALLPQHGTGAAHRQALMNDAYDGLTLFGNGVGSYHVASAAHSDHQQAIGSREFHVHSDALELVFEYGIVSGLLFIIVGMGFAAGQEREQLVLAAFLFEGLVGFPVFMPTTGFIAAVVAGHLCAGRHPLRAGVADRATSRGLRHRPF